MNTQIAIAAGALIALAAKALLHGSIAALLLRSLPAVALGLVAVKTWMFLPVPPLLFAALVGAALYVSISQFIGGVR